MKPEVKCSATVAGDWHRFPCNRAGSVREDGKFWCKQHAPSSVAARRKKSEDRWAAERKAADRRNAIFEAKLALIAAVEKAKPGTLPLEVERAIVKLRKVRG